MHVSLEFHSIGLLYLFHGRHHFDLVHGRRANILKPRIRVITDLLPVPHHANRGKIKNGRRRVCGWAKQKRAGNQKLVTMPRSRPHLSFDHLGHAEEILIRIRRIGERFVMRQRLSQSLENIFA